MGRSKVKSSEARADCVFNSRMNRMGAQCTKEVPSEVKRPEEKTA